MIFKLLSFIFHRLLAIFRREFWTGCPRCHESFGGHQDYAEQVIRQHLESGKPTNYRIVCPECKKDEGKAVL